MSYLLKHIGAFASILLFFTLSLHADYFYVDEVVQIPEVKKDIEQMGSELFAKTGVSLYLVAVKSTNNQSMSQIKEVYESQMQHPYITLFFSVETDKEHGVVEIFNSPQLQSSFNEEQILSPYPWKGTILPILASKIKEHENQKYGVALLNGYSDIADQVAEYYGVALSTSSGSGNKMMINFLRLIFYGVILFALGYYAYKKLFKRGNDE